MSLNPRVDFAFKKLFGSEENKDLLISFINSVVSEKDRIVEVTLLNPYNDREFGGDRLSVLDIKAKDEQGRQYNIEMQITDEVYYNQRALYYWSKLYTSQLKKGDLFEYLKKTISINVLNFNYFSDESDYHHVFHILNTKTHKRYFEDLELHFIELDKFDKNLSQLKTTLDRWTTFLSKASGYDAHNLPMELKIEPEIGKAIMALECMYLTNEERELYEGQLKWLRDEAAAIKKAELRGLEEGIEKGKVEGKAEGKAEAIETVARALINQGTPTTQIAHVTGLSHEAIESLKS